MDSVATITTFCYGSKYAPILPHWLKTVKEKCPGVAVKVFDTVDVLDNRFIPSYHGYIWAIRMKHVIDFMIRSRSTTIMCDLDCIVQRDVRPLVALPYDIIISKEIGGAGAYPQDCSLKLGFGVCAGFTILKMSALRFMMTIFKNMAERKYETYDDQVNIMRHIVNTPHKVVEESVEFDGRSYTNRIIEIDGIRICVLDFDLVVRDPVVSGVQFANHINIDNVGGTANFLRYFSEPLEKLPLTCRCGKFGDKTVCPHEAMRR
jgi:hypothetical protein